MTRGLPVNLCSVMWTQLPCALLGWRAFSLSSTPQLGVRDTQSRAKLKQKPWGPRFPSGSGGLGTQLEVVCSIGGPHLEGVQSSLCLNEPLAPLPS